MIDWQKVRYLLRQSYIFLILILIYLPLFIVVMVSFNGSTIKENINLDFGLGTGTGASAYSYLATDDGFLNGIINSVIIGVVSTPISIIIAVMTSFAIWNNKQIYRKLALGASSSSITTPDIISGLSLIVLFATTWLSFGNSLGLFTVIVSHISFCTPYALVTIYPRMQKMNPKLIQASEDLGVSKVATFFKITVPYLMPGILAGALIAFSMSFDDFVVTNLVRGSTQTIATQLYSMRRGVKAWAVAFGTIIILLTVLITIIFALRKWYIEREKHHDSIVKRRSKMTKLKLSNKQIIKTIRTEVNKQKVLQTKTSEIIGAVNNG